MKNETFEKQIKLKPVMIYIITYYDNVTILHSISSLYLRFILHI
jgi:hypothetical protein